MKDVTINGFEITEKAAEELGAWAACDTVNNYLGYLSFQQDLLCRMLEIDEQRDTEIKEALCQIVMMKDSFKKLL
jgi:hypothetical protein